MQSGFPVVETIGDQTATTLVSQLLDKHVFYQTGRAVPQSRGGLIRALWSDTVIGEFQGIHDRWYRINMLGRRETNKFCLKSRKDDFISRVDRLSQQTLWGRGSPLNECHWRLGTLRIPQIVGTRLFRVGIGMLILVASDASICD